MAVDYQIYYRPYMIDELNGRHDVIIKIIWELFVIQTSGSNPLNNFTSKISGVADIRDYTNNNRWTELDEIDATWLRREVLRAEDKTWAELRAVALAHHNESKVVPETLEQPAITPLADDVSWARVRPTLTDQIEYRERVAQVLEERRDARRAARDAANDDQGQGQGQDQGRPSDGGDDGE